MKNLGFLNLDSPTQLSGVFSNAGVEQQSGLEIALVRNRPYFLVNTIDSRVIEWEDRRINFSFLHLASQPFYVFDYSVLAVFVTLWQNALPGASYFNVSDFFDLDDNATVKWLEQVVITRTVQIPIFYKGRFTGFGFDDRYDQKRIDEMKRVVAAATKNDRDSRLKRENPGGAPPSRLYRDENAIGSPKDKAVERISYFEFVREFILSTWPDDPFKEFVLD